MNKKKQPADASLHAFPGGAPQPVLEPEAIPPGKAELVRTYLQMHSPPAPWRGGSRNEVTAIMRAHHCTVSFYRYLYDNVGDPWQWQDRRLLSETELGAIIGHEQVEIHVLYVAGTPAGYGELDRRQAGEIELVYFGLLPEFIGRGLGPYFLHWLQDTAWSYQPQRLWAHTCTLDHPSAMALYQRTGFVAYRQQRLIIDAPKVP